MLTNANSTIAANKNIVHPKNQTSLALMYDTFGNEFSTFDASVMNANIVFVPGKKLINE